MKDFSVKYYCRCGPLRQPPLKEAIILGIANGDPWAPVHLKCLGCNRIPMVFIEGIGGFRHLINEPGPIVAAKFQKRPLPRPPTTRRLNNTRIPR